MYSTVWEMLKKKEPHTKATKIDYSEWLLLSDPV